MIKNKIFKKFIDNPQFKEVSNLSDNQIKSIELSSNHDTNILTQVIRTAIYELGSENNSVDKAARRVNQIFKR